jgi:hypothetical protein
MASLPRLFRRGQCRCLRLVRQLLRQLLAADKMPLTRLHLRLLRRGQ